MPIFGGWPCAGAQDAPSPDPRSRLCRAEDQVRSDFEAHDRLYLLVAYKYLNALGLRIATLDSDLRRELSAG